MAGISCILPAPGGIVIRPGRTVLLSFVLVAVFDAVA
jgi:hypothetical protein